MSKILDIIKSSFLDGFSDLHFSEGDAPYARKLTKIVKIFPDLIITKDDFEYFMNELKISEKKKEELHMSGSFDFGFCLDEVGNFRLNIYMSQKRYSCAVRILPSKIPEFNSLNLSPSILNITNLVSGLVLITGLTGNGKSSTIASLINEINLKQQKHIITIEDPIEYHFPQGNSLVSQREIGVDCDSFASGLRAALRQDPDIIMIGEMRDKETILTAIEAAESGHLVFSTLHTGNTTSTIDRIISYFSNEEKNYICSKLSMILSVVVSQKLIISADQTKVYPAHEIMFMSDSIRNLIREGKYYQLYSFLQMNKESGSITFEEHLAELVSGGKITIEMAKLNSDKHKTLDGYILQIKQKLRK